MVAALSHVSIRPIVDSVTGSVAETRFETPQQGICSGVQRTTGEVRVLPFGPPRALCFKRKKTSHFNHVRSVDYQRIPK